jgi:NAD+ kinase
VSKYENAGIIYNPTIAKAANLAGEIQSKLKQLNTSSWLCSSWDEEKARESAQATSLLISIGGDGTILKTARIAIPWSIPILGINLGKLGFLTELSAKDAVGNLEQFLNGDGWIDKRAMIAATVNAQKEGHVTRHALNDITVARGQKPRVINISVSIDGARMTTYKSDGIIISTATGSTGYNLSCGGPIVHPESDDAVLLPIAAHLTLSAPLVLPSGSTISVRVDFDHKAVLSVDGQVEIELASGDFITIEKSQYSAYFLRMQPQNYFYGTLMQKLSRKREL